MRAVNRHRPELAERAVALLQRIMMVPLDHAIVVGSALSETRWYVRSTRSTSPLP